ncbi:hypothetical protein EMCRGX_G034974 [Ephydatia muelleri]
MACTSGGCGQSNSSSLKTLQAMPTFQAALNVTALNAVTALSNPNGLLIHLQCVSCFRTGERHSHYLQCPVVHNPQPSTQYSFVEAACTTAGCQTGGVTNVTTLDSAPVGQAPPSSPLPCPSNGMLPSNPTMSSLPTPCTIESPALSPSQICGDLLRCGILFHQINSVVTDFLGVKLHGGLPWLIFDVGSGPAVVVSNSTRTFNDGQWHTHVSYPLLNGTSHRYGFDAVSVQNVGSTYIIVSWDLPTHSNGILINFSLYCNGALVGVLPLTVISYNTTSLLPFTLYMYMPSSHARRHCTPVGMGVNSAAASLPRPYGGAYSHSPIPQLEQDNSSPLLDTENFKAFSVSSAFFPLRSIAIFATEKILEHFANKITLNIQRSFHPSSFLETLQHLDSTRVENAQAQAKAIRVLKGEKVGKFHSVDESKCVCVLSGSSPEVGSRSQESLESIITSLVCDAEDLSSEERKQLKELLHRFSDVISLSDSDIGRTEMIQHHINTENAKPVKQAPRRLPFHHLKEVKKLVESMLDNNVIEPSNGPWASPIVLVKKKDGSTRFCVDFRQLNSVTRKDAHPIPRIDETLDALHGACWFSTLDLASGYWQVKVAPEDPYREKTAFTTPYGLYQFCVMPFGLCNAPSTFQRLMELVLAGLHWSSCLVYLDDIIIYSRTVKEHLTRLEEVLERLQAAGMKLKPKKCRLLRRKVNYLGYIVSSGGVQTDPLKVECILSWPSPTTQKELRQFLGLASYYRRFVKGFASIAAPLNHLLEKGKPWEWTKVCEHAFSSLKKMLTTSPILAYPDFEIEFTVDCDASGDGLGAVLSQCIGGGENVISYASRSLTKPEKKYCATRKEMLALMWRALQWLYSFKEPEGQVARWLESLAEYEFTVQHRPGKKHTNADALSRVPCQDAPAVNANSIPLDRTDSWLSQLSKREIRELQSRDEGIEQVIEWVEHPKTQPQRCPPSASHVMKSLWAQKKYLEVIDGVLYRRWEDAGGGGLNKCFQLVIPEIIYRGIGSGGT